MQVYQVELVSTAIIEAPDAPAAVLSGDHRPTAGVREHRVSQRGHVARRARVSRWYRIGYGPGPWRPQRARAAARVERALWRLPNPWRRRPVDYLDAITGHDTGWWVRRCQDEIAATWVTDPNDPDHGVVTYEWLQTIINEVTRAYGETAKGRGDGNIGAATAIALVLGAWSLRVARAKDFDPRRPLEIRRSAYGGWLRVAAAFTALTYDESYDPEAFDQPWENPHHPDATDGDFV